MFQRGRTMKTTTHKPNVRKEVREDPDARLDEDPGEDVEDEAEDGEAKEEGDDAEHGHAEVPYADPERGRPEGEHDSCENHGHHRDTPEQGLDLAAFDEPDVVLVRSKVLLSYDLQHLHRRPFHALRRGRRDAVLAVHLEEERERDDGLEETAGLFLICDLWDVL